MRSIIPGRTSCPSPVLHPDTKPTVAGPPDHLLELAADGRAGAVAKTQLHLAIAQDGLDLRVALEARRIPVLTAMRDRMRAKGKAPKTILIAVARQLLVILNAMIRKRQPIAIG